MINIYVFAAMLVINGHPFGNAVQINGVWAVPLEDFQKNVEGTFTVAGNRVQMSAAPRDTGSGMATGKRTHKPIRIVTPVGSATPLLTAGGKQYIALSEVAKLSGATFTAPANLPAGAPIVLTFSRAAHAAIDWGD